MRLSAYLAQKFGFSRRFAKALLHNGKVSLRGSIIKADISIAGDDSYNVDIASPVVSYVLSDYLLKDAGDVVFFYKPAGMHTERLNPADSLCISDIVDAEFSEHSLISRLDYSVNGVIAALKRNMTLEIQEKRYIALVEGDFPAELSQYWDMDASKRRQVKAYPSDNGILMQFKCLNTANGQSLVEVILEKAHRHQVRATLAALGHPIIGDMLYNGQNTLPEQIELHCTRVVVNHYSFDLCNKF